MTNPFQTLDFVTCPHTNQVHVVTGVFGDRDFLGDATMIQIDGIRGAYPHYKNFRHATKEEISDFIDKRLEDGSE